MKRILQKSAISCMLFALLWAFSLPIATAQTNSGNQKDTKGVNDACDISTLPFIDNFNAGLSSCWKRLGTAPVANASAVLFQVTAGYGMLITPMIEANISHLRINFSFQTNLAGGKLEVGVMTDPTNVGSFVLVEDVQLRPIGATAYEYSVPFSSYGETGKYIAFRYTASGFGFGFLDNINIDYHVADCEEPSNFNRSNIGGRTAVLTWGASSSMPDEYEVLVTNAATGDTAINTTTEGTQMFLSGLSINTKYDAKVRSVCNDVNFSSWRSVDFTTQAVLPCARPNYFIVTKIRPNQANLSWLEDGVSANRYVVGYNVVGETQWVQDTVSDSNDFVEYTLTNLAPNTEYNVRVIALCESGNSTAATTNFRTLCTPITTLPYMENFDNVMGGTTANGLLPSCWNYNKSNTTNRPFVDWQGSANATNSKSRFGALNLHVSSSTTNIAILPSFDVSGLLINDLQVDFWSRNSDNLLRGVFTLGVMDDIEDETTFTPVKVIEFTEANTWENFSIPLSSYPGNGNFIAFKWSGGSNSYLYVDDIYIDKISNCPKPTSLKIESIAPESVYCSWESSTTDLEITYAPTGVAPNWEQASIVSENPIALHYLSPMTQYNVYLRSICYDNSTYSIPLVATFWSGCDIITEAMLPYTESFDKYGTGKLPSCWTSGSTVSPVIATTNYSAPGSLAFSYTTTELEAVTGELDMNISDLQIDFMLRASSFEDALVVGVMESQNTFIPIDTIYGSVINTWENRTIYFNKYAGNGKHIAFRVIYGTIHIDDMVISKSSLCFIPDRLAVHSIKSDEVTLTWRENGNASKWEVRYGPVGFNPQNSASGITTINTTENPVTISYLPENTVADFYVRAVCGGSDYSEWSAYSATFHTPKAITTLPYMCDFEDQAENDDWVIINGTQTNKWHIGSAANNGGTKSLYVSSQNGGSHYYTLGSTSYVYAIRSLNFTEADEYEIFFDWKAYGSLSMHDVMRVFLVPATVALKAGDANGMTSNLNTPPGEWIELSNNPLYGADEWLTQNSSFSITTPAIYNLVVFWKNFNTYSGRQYPGAIDNIVIQSLSCSQPRNLALSNVDGAIADITWAETGSSNQWEVQYGKTGFTLGSGTTLSVVGSLACTITDIEPFATYDVYVRSICLNTDTSLWSPRLTFRETCPAPSTPSVFNINRTSAYVTWGSDAGIEWVIDYKKSIDNNFGYTAIVAEPQHFVTGLHPDTEYDLRIRTMCHASGNMSEGTVTSFRTASENVTIYTITPTAENGKIIPDMPMSVIEGNGTTFYFTPNNGYEMDNVRVDGIIVPVTEESGLLSYTFTDVKSSAAIHATFKRITTPADTFIITASAGANGTINPIGEIKVKAGDSQTFTFTPNQEYIVQQVMLNGAVIGGELSSYTVENVQANQTIHVDFAPNIAISQYQLDNSVLIYPNPASEQLNVKLSAVFEQLEITNLLGQVIYTTTVTEQEFTINVNDCRSGVYFIRLSGKQGVATKKFIKE